MTRFHLYLATVFALIATIGLFLDPYGLFVLSRMMVFAILCLGLNILMGYAGQFAFANAAMFGIGAYATGLAQVRLGLPFLPAAAIGITVTTFVGSLLVLPALRLSGLYLAMTTVSFALAVQWVFLNWTSVTFGAGGFQAPALEPVAGLSPDQTVFLLTILVAAVLYWFADNILRSRIGRSFVQVRENEIAAASNGINVFRVKLLAFALSAFYAGVAGALSVPLYGFVAPESFDLNQMILHQIMVVVGGMASLPGSLLGPILVTVLIEVLRDVQGVLEIVYGGILIIFVLWLPEGVGGLLQRALGIREPYRPRGLSNGKALRMQSHQPGSKPLQSGEKA